MASLFPASPASASKARGPLTVAALVAAVLAIYAPMLRQPFILLDDPGYITADEHVRAGLTWAGFSWAWTNFRETGWQPLTWLSLMFDAHVYGLRPGGYYLTNLLLQMVGTLLLFRWLRVTTKAFWMSALTAFFFATHPMRVDSFAWVADRRNALGLLFFCLTLLAYTRYAWSGSGRMRYFWLALAFFAPGLLAEPMLITLPPLLLLLDYWPLRRFPATAIREHWRRLVVEKLPFVVLAGIAYTVALCVQEAPALPPAESLPWLSPLVSAVTGVYAYLAQTFWPVTPEFFYPYRQEAAIWLVAIGGVLLGLGIVGAVRRWRQQPSLTIGVLWFLGILIFVDGLLTTGGHSAADRCTYLPHIGLFVAVLWTGRTLATRWPGASRPLTWLALLAVACCLGLSIRQVHVRQETAARSGRALTGTNQSNVRIRRPYDRILPQRTGRAAWAVIARD